MPICRSQLTPILVIGSLFFYLILQLYIATPRQAKKTVSTFAAGSGFGFNIHSLPLLSPADISQTLSMAAKCNNTTLIRFWGFSGGDNIGKVLDNSPANIKFVVTLSNFYQEGVNQPWPAPQGNETSWFASDWKTNGYREFIDTVSKKYKGNSKILIWELMNEPNCTADTACSQAQHQFFREASAIIAANDPGKLISPGTQAQNTGGEHFENGDFEDIASMPNITALSCHIQVGGDSSASLELQKQNCVTALQITKQRGKFFYTGEFGENLNCTDKCINGCSQEQLQARKNEITSIANQLNALGNDATLVWQFSPEQNPTLTCDGASVFPKDPFCSITGATTLNGQGGTGGQTGTGGNAGGTTTGGGGGGGTGATSINFTPQNPAANTDFSVTTTATTPYTWVYLKISKQGETNAFWQAANNLADEPSVSQGPPASWTYHIGKGKPTSLPAGDYKVTFYSDCDKGCTERASRTLSIGNNKTNETQTPPTKQTTAQQQAKPAQNQQVPQQQNPQAVGAKPDAKFCNKLDIRAGKKKYNLVILPAGYNSSQDFLSDARVALNSLNKTNLKPNTRNKIDIWAYSDTSLNLAAGFCDDRGICFDQGAARNFAQTCGGDGYAIILNNKSEERGISYGVCGGEAAITNVMVDGGIRPFPHELGHAIACLNDEYLVGGRIQEKQINCSTESSCPGWEKYGNAGCYPVCNSGDWFKSSPQSTMNNGQNFIWQFNPPSLEGWDNQLQNYE